MKWIEEKQALYRRNQELVEKVHLPQAAGLWLLPGSRVPVRSGRVGPRVWALRLSQSSPDDPPARPSVLLRPGGSSPAPGSPPRALQPVPESHFVA